MSKDVQTADVVYVTVDWDSFNQQIIVGYNNSGVGFAQFGSNKVTEAAALPSTVITNGSLIQVWADPANGDLWAISSGGATNGFAVSTDGGATWTAVVPGLALGLKQSIRVLDSTRWVALTNTFGGFDVAFSDNLGGAWTEQLSGVSAGGTTTSGIAMNANRDSIAISSSNDFLTFSGAADLAATPIVWTTLDLGLAAADPLNDAFIAMDFNADGSIFLCGGTSGSMYFSNDSMATFTQIEAANNPFMNGPGVAGNKVIRIVRYSAFYAGFFVLADEYGAFFPENDLTNPTAIDFSMFEPTATIPAKSMGGAVDGAGQAMFPQTTVVNLTLKTYPLIP